MPDKALHRLESYQSGGSIGGCDDDIGVTTSDVNNANAGGAIRNSAPHPLLSQFSLIGQVDDDDEEAILENNGSHFNQRTRLRQWYMMYHRRFTILQCFFLLLALIGAYVGTGIIGKKRPSSTTASSEETSCPIQSSYFVSSDIMELKNSSSGE